MASVLRFDDWETTLGTSVAETDGSGNVAIGGSSPSYKLDVTGDINASSDIKLAGDSMPRGIVGYNETTSDVSLSTSDATLCSVTCDVVAGRRYLVVSHGYSDNADTTMVIVGELQISAGGGTRLQAMGQVATTTIDRTVLSCSVVYEPASSGSETFTFQANTTTGTAKANAASDRPLMLAVIDIGES